MVVAIAAGVLLASVFFMQRMSSVSTVDFVSSDEVDEKNKLPRGIERFCIHGPLFFGSAQRSLEVIQPWKDGLAAVIDLADVPFIDSTGILRLREAVDRLHISDLSVALTAVQPDTKVALDNSRFFELHPFLRIFQTSAEAIDVFKHEKSTHPVGPQA
jgi:SulP family sulfate permease